MRRPAPPEACDVLAATATWWRILLDPDSRALDAEFSDAGRRARSRSTEAWAAREPQNAEAHFYAGAAYAARVQWRVLRDEKLAAARDGKRIKRRSNAPSRSIPTSTTRISAIGLYQVLRRRRAGGRQDAALPADAARRQQDRRAGADAARARRAAGCCRGKPTTSCRSSISGTSTATDLAVGILQSLHERYPGNPLFLVAARRGPGSLSARHHRQPRDLARAARAGARTARQRVGPRRGAGPAGHRPPARRALPDRSRASSSCARSLTRQPSKPFGALAAAYLALGEARGSPRPSRRRGRRLSRRRERRRRHPDAAGDPPARGGADCATRRTPTRAEAYRLSLEGLRKLETIGPAGRRSRCSRGASRSIPTDPVARYRYGRVLQAPAGRCRRSRSSS